MHNAHEALIRLYLALTAPRVRDERGDVPGWVMVTVLTIAMATAIFGVARDELSAMLTRAFAMVKEQ